MCDTSRYLVADPWFAVVLFGGGMRCGMESLAEGEVAGFSTTTPNCANAVGVSSSMGMRIDGDGIDVGMLADCLWCCLVLASSVMEHQAWRSGARTRRSSSARRATHVKTR